MTNEIQPYNFIFFNSKEDSDLFQLDELQLKLEIYIHIW